MERFIATNATPQKKEAPKKEGPETPPDSPLLDLTDVATKKLVRSAKKRGYVMAWARKLPAPGVRSLFTKLPMSPPTSCVARGWKPTMPFMK